MDLDQSREIKSLAQLQSLAQLLAQELPLGSVLALTGQLGSGKTTFTQMFAKELGVSQRLVSPTYVLMREYELPLGQNRLYHLDLYRIASAEDIKAIDLSEIIAEGKHYVVIEWPEKIQDLLPANTVRIEFRILGATKRQVTILTKS